MNGWTPVKLSDVLVAAKRAESVDATKQYRLLGVRLEGRGPFIRETVLGSQSSASKLFEVEAGDFIYSRLFACRGAFGVIDESTHGCYVSGEFPIYQAIPECIDVQFLRYWFTLPSVIARVDEDCTGSTPLTRNRFKENFFLALEIPLPPLAEQRRIVARLEALAAQIDEARRLRKEAVEEAVAFAASSLASLLPRNTETVKLDSLIAPESKISYGVLVPGPDVEDGVPFVRIQDLAIKNAPAIPNKHIAPEIDAQYHRTKLVGGEILIGVVGSIGKIGIAPMSWAGANIARAVCRIVPGPQTDRDYLAAVLSAKPCQDFFRETTRTLAQPTLNVGQLSQTPIPVPQLKEQRRIVAELDALQEQVDTLKRLQSETAAELDALLPAILDRAFKGEL